MWQKEKKSRSAGSKSESWRWLRSGAKKVHWELDSTKASYRIRKRPMFQDQWRAGRDRSFTQIDQRGTNDHWWIGLDYVAYKARIGVFSGSYGSHGSSKTITDGEDWTTGTTVSEWNSVSRDGFSEDWGPGGAEGAGWHELCPTTWELQVGARDGIPTRRKCSFLGLFSTTIHLSIHSWSRAIGLHGIGAGSWVAVNAVGHLWVHSHQTTTWWFKSWIGATHYGCWKLEDEAPEIEKCEVARIATSKKEDNNPGGWEVLYQEGKELVSDGLTKPLQGQAFQRFVVMLKLNRKEEEGTISGTTTSSSGLQESALFGSTSTSSGLEASAGSAEKEEYAENKGGKIGTRQCAVRSVAVHDGAAALIGAGATLVALDRHRGLGALLCVAGLAMKCFENSQKESQKPDEQQDRKKKNNQDPERTPWDPRESGTTPKGKALGPTSSNQPQSCNEEGGRDEVGVVLPGLRAIRRGDLEKSKETRHGSESTSRQSSSATARAAAAGPIRLEGTSSETVETYVGTQVNVPVNVVVNVGQGEFDQQKRKRQGLWDTGYRRDSERFWSHAVSVEVSTQSTTKKQTMKEEAKSHQGSSAEPMNVTESLAAESPWLLDEYKNPPTRKSDLWDLKLLDRYGWAIRAHGKLRKRSFHPIHRSTPWSATVISSTRTSSVFEKSGRRRIITDVWSDPRCIEIDDLKEQWTGYSFFKVDLKADGSKDLRESMAFSNAAVIATECDDASDGSYELVRPWVDVVRNAQGGVWITLCIPPMT